MLPLDFLEASDTMLRHKYIITVERSDNRENILNLTLLKFALVKRAKANVHQYE